MSFTLNVLLLMFSLAVSRPLLYSTSKGVFMPFLHRLRYHWTTRAFAWFSVYKKYPPSSRRRVNFTVFKPKMTDYLLPLKMSTYSLVLSLYVIEIFFFLLFNILLQYLILLYLHNIILPKNICSQIYTLNLSAFRTSSSHFLLLSTP